MNAPRIAGLDVLPEEVLHARNRPPVERTPRPEVGQRVWYRHRAHGALERAEVVEVVEDESDPSTHRYVVHDPTQGPVTDPATGRRLRELVNDPWWSVLLKVEGHAGLIMTREARIAGSPGWLPLNQGG